MYCWGAIYGSRLIDREFQQAEAQANFRSDAAGNAIKDKYKYKHKQNKNTSRIKLVMVACTKSIVMLVKLE